MDSQCDYLVLDIPKDPDADNAESVCELCTGPIRNLVGKWNREPIRVSLEQAVAGSMVPYLDAGVSEHDLGEHAQQMRTGVWYVTNDALVEVEGDIHLRDVPPNGAWLSSPKECSASIQRLRCAGLACIALPELNRMVIEQKNDDGLLHLTRESLANADTVAWAVELFGAFACDAMLAPVLHEILRSSWVKERKSMLDANNELKLGWAQEFYDYKRVPKDAVGSLLFTCLQGCGSSAECAGDRLAITRSILGEMRLSGYTPWSAVRAVRLCESAIANAACEHCKTGLLASCAFLLECAATEASRERDWLVRNEAVIQLCWILYNVYLAEEPVAPDVNLEHWAVSTAAHSVKYQLYKSKEHRDIESLVILFANDHLPVTRDERDASETEPETEPETPRDLDVHQGYDLPIDLENALLANGRYSTGDSFVPAGKVKAVAFDDIPTAVDVANSLPSGTTEARPQDPEDVAAAIVLCFPRVAETAVSQLSFEPPARHASELWPVFVNSTRACYRLFRALDVPVSPHPTYLLEILARGWRGIPPRTLKLFLPMTAGPLWRVEQRHYAEYFLGPLSNLFSLGVITESDRDTIIKALHRGILPCFAGRCDSPCDRLLSSTLTLSFAACGITALSQAPETAAIGLALDSVSVTSAGLLYFAAWYLVVYLSAVYSHQALRITLSTSGSEADKHLCRAFRISEQNGSVEEYRGHDIAQALRLVFKDMLSEHMLLRLVQLYVPEMLTQLPYVRRTGLIPGNVTTAMEARDLWFDKDHAHTGRREDGRPGFEYLGPIAYGLHSSLKGRLSLNTMRPVANSLSKTTDDDDFDLWCDSLYEYNKQGLDAEHVARLDLEDSDMSSYRDDTGHDPSVSADTSVPKDTSSSSPSDSDKTSTIAPPPVPGAHSSASGVVAVDADDAAGSEGVLGSLMLAISNLSLSQDRYVCKGLVLDTADNVGVTTDGFLRSDTRAVRVSGQINFTPAITTPCMTNFSETVYGVNAYDNCHCVKSDFIYPGLIQALWVLTSAHMQQSGAEPQTPEALAVMVHLIAKALPSALSSQLPVCNDVMQLLAICNKERQFVPVAAVVGGMFNLNIQVIVNKKIYTVANSQYTHTPPGVLCLTQRGWCVVDGPAVPAVPAVPRASLPPVDVFNEYLRLNDLAVIPVPKDNYCGFHTALVLLGRATTWSDQARGELVQKTANYMMLRKTTQDIAVYLEVAKVREHRDLYELLMTPDRWLSVEELYFILLAHGRKSSFITKQSYPLYSDDHVYFHIDNNHFQPVVRNRRSSYAV